MRRTIIKTKDATLRKVCEAALKAHREKFGEHQPSGKSRDYKLELAGKKYWVCVTSCAKSYVAKPC